MKARKFLGLFLAVSLAVTTAGTSVVPVAAANQPAVQDDSGSTLTEAEKLEQDKNALSIPTAALTDSITLPQRSASGYNISWVSDNAAIKIEDGKGIVTRGTEAVTVKLTATITGTEKVSGSDALMTVTKDFTVAVPTEQQVLDIEVNALRLPTSTTDDFDLPNVSQNGYSITWSMEENNFIKIEGKKAIVTAGDTAGTVKLTATVKGNSELTSTKEFTITIPVYYFVKDEVKEVTGCFPGHPEWGQPLSNLNNNSITAFWNAYDDPKLKEADYKQEVAYEFKRMVELDSAIINWADNGGVVVPSEITFKYWDVVTDSWKDVTPKGDWVYTGGDPAREANTYNFETIITNKLRLVMTNTVVNGEAKGVGIFEWNLTGSRWVKNLTDLNTEITAAEAYKNEDRTYTTSSFAELQSVLQEAKAVAAKGDDATQEEIDLYILKLPVAVDGLKLAVVNPGPGSNDKTELAAELTKAGKLIQTEYTDASWTSFDTVYKDAMAVNDNKDATQEEIDTAVASLKEATEALVVKGSEKELDIELEKLTLSDRVIAEEISLPLQNEDGFTLSWESDHAAITVDDEAGKGAVTRGESDVTVKLTVTITAKNTIGTNEKPLTKTKEFSVLVPEVYLAKSAKATASYGYGSTLTMINDEINNGTDNNGWNGWRGSNVPETDWIQYEFPNKLELTAFTIRWFDNEGGVVAPSSIAFQYYDIDSDSWKEIVPAGDAWEIKKDADSVYTFEKIVTNKIKLLITNGKNSQNNTLGAYICEWGVTGKKWAPTKAQIQASITAASALDESHYTEDTYSDLTAAIEAAQTVAAKEAPTSDELIAAWDGLQAAMAGLKYTRAGLAAAIEAAPKETESSDYTEESWEVYTSALEAVNAVNNNTEATDAQIDAAARALQAAVAALEVKPADKAVLEAALAAAPKAADAPKYTKASWAPYKTVLDKANEVFAKAKATQSEVNKAASDLTEAKDTLVEKNTNMAALAEAISNAPTAADKKPYMINSWKTYEKILNDAIAVSEEEEPTQTEVDDAAAKLNDAAAAMTDYSVAMQKVLDEEENGSKYTPESWATLLEAVKLAAGLETNKDADATMEDVKTVTKALDDAAKGLTPKPVDKTALEAAIAKAPKEADKDKYTENSWKKMSDALTAANTVNGDADATQAEVNKAAEDLEAAITDLVEKVPETGVSKTALEAAIAKAPKEADKDKYTEDSWKKMSDALTAANTVNGDADATQAEVDKAAEDLEAAITGLVEKTPETGASKEAIEALKKAVNAAKKLKKGDYASTGWKDFEAALKAAEQILDKEDASQSEVEEATTNLIASQGKLVKMKITSKSKSLVVGETFSVKATGCTYSTSNKSVATVSKGKVTAKKAGKAVIKATNKSKNTETQYTITVKKAPTKIAKVTYKVKGQKKAKKITLKKNKGTITLKKGKSATLTPTLPNKTYSKFKYTLSGKNAKKIASVSAKGVVKAKKKGTVKVKIQTLNKKSVTITIKIK